MTQCSVPGYSCFTMCSEKSEHNCLTSFWYTAAILPIFFLFACLRRCFSLNLSNRNKKNNGNQQKTRLEASKPPTVFTTALRERMGYRYISQIRSILSNRGKRTKSESEINILRKIRFHSYALMFSVHNIFLRFPNILVSYGLSSSVPPHQSSK